MLNFKNLIITLSGIIVVMLILFSASVFVSVFTPRENVNGTYYGEGDFGSIKIVVKEDYEYINYDFNFTDEYVKQILETKIYYLEFVANKKNNMYRDTTRYTKENDLLYRGVIRDHITKPFTLLNIKVNSHNESVELKKID